MIVLSDLQNKVLRESIIEQVALGTNTIEDLFSFSIMEANELIAYLDAAIVDKQDAIRVEIDVNDQKKIDLEELLSEYSS